MIRPTGLEWSGQTRLNRYLFCACLGRGFSDAFSINAGWEDPHVLKTRCVKLISSYGPAGSKNRAFQRGRPYAFAYSRSHVRQKETLDSEGTRVFTGFGHSQLSVVHDHHQGVVRVLHSAHLEERTHVFPRCLPEIISHLIYPDFKIGTVSFDSRFRIAFHLLFFCPSSWFSFRDPSTTTRTTERRRSNDPMLSLLRSSTNGARSASRHHLLGKRTLIFLYS